MAGGVEAVLFEELHIEPRLGTGILPAQQIRMLIARKQIQASAEIKEEQIQPASLDLRLGSSAYRVRASFLPGRETRVLDKISSFRMHEIDLTNGAVLEKGCVYIVKLMEGLRLTREYSAIANPKSSIGRLDVFVRLITDSGTEFDHVPQGYQGELFVEISPLAFSIVVRQGSRLNQLRLKRGSPSYGESKHKKLLAQVRDPRNPELAEETYRGALPITVDLSGIGGTDLIGFKARNHAPLVDVDVKNAYDAFDFWEPIQTRQREGIILDPNDFYILASKEAVSVPEDHAAEMVAYDTLVGEFRVHYAGFFDPGFGCADATGTRAVLEVQSHEVPFLVEDGQIVGRLVYEKMAAKPDKIYGENIGSSYQRQGLALSKHFKKVHWG